MNACQLLPFALCAVAFPAFAQHLEPSAPLGERGRGESYAPKQIKEPAERPTAEISSATSESGLTDALTSPIAESRDIPSLPPSTQSPTTGSAGDRDDLVAHWISYTVRLFPDLADRKSTHHQAFVALYERTKLTNPQDLAEPDWPLRLAIRSASPATENTNAKAFSPGPAHPSQANIPSPQPPPPLPPIAHPESAQSKSLSKY